jgi:hypothetical protein
VLEPTAGPSSTARPPRAERQSVQKQEWIDLLDLFVGKWPLRAQIPDII